MSEHICKSDIFAIDKYQPLILAKQYIGQAFLLYVEIQLSVAHAFICVVITMFCT